MNRKLAATSIGIGLLLVVQARAADEVATGYRKQVTVTAPTRIDWTFALTTKSMAKPPADWLPNYDSTKQHYELYVPANYSAKKAYPLIVFVSAGSSAAGWAQLEKLCKAQGILFAAPYGAGNECDTRKRIRIILDVLDDVRRKYRVDADRTYVSGFSGGARMACALAFGLPEYFGGAFPVCASGDLREETWLRQRVVARQSIAFLTGEDDFNRAELERWRGPMIKELGARCRVWVFPKMGHGMPRAEQFAEVVAWLEEGLEQRQELAKVYPASRAAEKAATREANAALLLAEGKKRLQDIKTLHSGLMMLQGCMQRWDDLPPADEAKKILLDYQDRKDWQKDDVIDQLRFLIAQARGLDAYVSGPLPPQYVKERSGIAEETIRRWETIMKNVPEDSEAGKQARSRIPELRKLVDK